jgi:D-glycero-D-manno-heptose 1,7-bisphosphate phosphatase
MTPTPAAVPHADWVILDRDGVINYDSPNFIKSPAEWIPIPGSLEAIARLNRAGYRVVIATNQSGIARGLLDWGTLRAIHQTLERTLTAFGGHLDDLTICPHGPDDNCPCRKPRPGLLLQAAEAQGRSLYGVPVVGDSRRDLQAARAVAARPVLVMTGKGEDTARSTPAEELAGIPRFPDLAAFVDDLLATHPSASR